MRFSYICIFSHIKNFSNFKKVTESISRGREDGREVQDGGAFVFLWLIHVVRQKPTQHCKAIILPFKKLYSLYLLHNCTCDYFPYLLYFVFFMLNK